MDKAYPIVATNWADGEAYERYMGRWSRPIAALFVRWLGVREGSAWLDVGCGTGALTQTILATANPRLVMGCDRSAEYVATAQRTTSDPRALFVVALPNDAPNVEGGFDAAVSGLVLNFLPDPAAALGAMRQRVRPGGLVGAYVWDYSRGMEMLRIFWDAVRAFDPSAEGADEARFAICYPDALRDAFIAAGLKNVVVDSIASPMVFRDFDDFWNPFLGGQGPGPGFVKGLEPASRDAFRELLRSRLPIDERGEIVLTSLALAARGTV